MYGRRRRFSAGRAGTFIATDPQTAYADVASSVKRMSTLNTTVLVCVLVVTVRRVEKPAFPSNRMRARQKCDEQLGC